MPGPVRADGLFFACAKSKVKSTHKGEAPLCIPRKGARLWLGGKDTHVTARPDLFFAQTGPLTRPGPRRKTPLHSARPDWRTRLAGEGHTGRGHCPLAREAARRVVAAYAALRRQPRRPEEGALRLSVWAGAKRMLPQNPITLCSNGSVHKACRGGAYGEGALPPSP